MKSIWFAFACILFFTSCNTFHQREANIRQMIDSVGFATQAVQMDSVMNRINRDFEQQLENISLLYDTGINWKVAIAPHDDYAYASYLYPAIFKNINADVLFLIGVFHKAKYFDTYDAIVMGKQTAWAGPYGNTKVSEYNREIINALPDSIIVAKDSMMQIEHSLEAFLPFIQYYNRDAEIIPIIIPYTKLDNMKEFSWQLANIIADIARDNEWKWGKDFAIVISTDAVHYGDESWGDNNFAFYGTDISGYRKAVEHENEIIDSCLSESLTEEKILRFVDYTVDKDDYKQYKWTWCGRYSVPFGLYTAWHLQDLLGEKPLNGHFIEYANSIDHPMLEVEDLGMGTTAPANDHHWVGYTIVGYK